MISSYSKWGKYDEALKLTSIMHHGTIKLNMTTLSSILSVCVCLSLVYEGKELPCLVLKTRFERFEFFSFFGFEKKV